LGRALHEILRGSPEVRLGLGDLGISTVREALHLPVTDVTVLEPLNDGDDVNVRITMSRSAAEGT
jgi:hypothetical protein